MNKSAVAGALIALTGSALVAPSSAVADPPPLTVTFDGGDATLSEREGLIVGGISSSAVRVRLTYADLPVQVLEVKESTATGFLETWGLTGSHDLLVAECLDTFGQDCGEDATFTTTVDNPSPSPELSRSGSEFSVPFDLTVHLAQTTGAPRVQLTTDDGTPAYVDPEAVTPVDTVALGDGAHQIDVAVCSADELALRAGRPGGLRGRHQRAGRVLRVAAALQPQRRRPARHG